MVIGEETLIKIYIINLKRDFEKKVHMQNICKKFKLNPEFIDAVDGKFLSRKEIKTVYSKEEAIKNIGREMTKGEIACALSHKSIYQKMIDDNIDNALILEDDVDFDDRLLHCLSMIDDFPSERSSKWEVVLLGHHSERSRESITKHGVCIKN